MVPNEGILAPDSKKTVRFTFSPRQEKVFNRKFMIRIPPDRKFFITAKGQGTSVNLSISRDKLNIGPVLPYDDTIYVPIEITNNSDYNNEFYCLETDKQYTDEDRQIAQYDMLQGKDKLFFPTREEPDFPFWKKIQNFTTFNEKKKELEKQMDKEKSQDKKDEIQEAIDKLTDDYMNQPVYQKLL